MLFIGTVSGANPGILGKGGVPQMDVEGEGARNVKIRVLSKRFPGIWDQNPRPIVSLAEKGFLMKNKPIPKSEKKGMCPPPPNQAD